MSTPPLTAYGSVAPAGWYVDPANPHGRRYWDGSAWTQHTAGATAPTAPRASSVSTGLVVAGYVLAVLAPVIGLILGIVAVKKHDGTGTNHGVWIIVTAAAAFCLYVLMIAAAGSSSPGY
jgi:hypothetical protein